MKTDNREQINKLFEAIGKAQKVCIFPHVDPDGDTLGSALALQSLIRRLGKPTQVVLQAPPPERMNFMPGFESIGTLECTPQCKDMLAISVDVSVSDRMGEAEPIFLSASLTAQIDHHETNPRFAQVNIVDGKAPSTASIVFSLFKAAGMKLTQDEATNLYVGLSTDTGNFKFKYTDADAFRIMAELMEAGLDIEKYARLLFLRMDREQLALLGRALPTLRYSADGKVAGMYIDHTTMVEIDPAGEYCEGIVNYALNARGVRLAYMVREVQKGVVKCSLRALTLYRVDEVALKFGGGGYMLAAGCTLSLPLLEAADLLQAELVKACAEADALGK
ncbi:MAG TPA: bifunctional oligoribonuclease/PAP phosphatase NrnA [Candidatus Limiplasma sp.]|nr:bifunctional oligoribonuclease/PAP phosphatase NrnA [Candidatus Limiplasma sp.]